MNKINALSLFASAGIGELSLHNGEINIIAANELLTQRAECYSFFYPQTKMFNGDITDENLQKEIIKFAKENNIKFLLATPPCQGLSSIGKNKQQEHFIQDNRNFLIMEVFKFIDALDFDYILIENVPRFLEMYFPFCGEFFKLEDIIRKLYSERYKIEVNVLNAKDYGICQSRPRSIIKMYKSNLSWSNPKIEKEISLREAIGHLPSLEPNEKSSLKWHYSKKTRDAIIEALRHTPTGKSAMSNEIYYPKKENGEKIKGFHNTYKRMDWDKPAPARTTYSGSVSSHNNVHPGRRLEDGTYSDPRALSMLETFIVSSIREDIEFPKWASETFIRTVIGEAIPPKMLEKICYPNGDGKID